MYAVAKKALILPSILALRISTGHITFDADGSDVQVGCVLLEQREKLVQPIRYLSWSFTNAKSRYDTTKREFLAIVWAVLLLRPYLENTRLTVRKNDDSLKWFLNLTNRTGRIAPWCNKLSEYECNDVHRVAIKHQPADALFRPYSTDDGRTILEDDLPVLGTDINEIEVDFRVIDANCKEIMPSNAESQPSENGPSSEEELTLKQAKDNFCRLAATQVDTFCSNFTVDEKNLFMRNPLVVEANKIVVPSPLLHSILHLFQ